ncbi:MAG: hypothetical protein IJK23_08925, partial [Clostridia bacterium]|nr:hypothetical protein [Clostridia bacterium]
FEQSDEKSDSAICAPELISAYLGNRPVKYTLCAPGCYLLPIACCLLPYTPINQNILANLIAE